MAIEKMTFPQANPEQIIQQVLSNPNPAHAEIEIKPTFNREQRQLRVDYRIELPRRDEYFIGLPMAFVVLDEGSERVLAFHRAILDTEGDRSNRRYEADLFAYNLGPFLGQPVMIAAGGYLIDLEGNIKDVWDFVQMKLE